MDMSTNKKEGKGNLESIEADLGEHFWENSCWPYIKTIVDVVREPVLIIEKDLRVMIANEPFYRVFQVEAKDTEKKLVYELGNGQWDIPALRKLLEDNLSRLEKDFNELKLTL